MRKRIIREIDFTLVALHNKNRDIRERMTKYYGTSAMAGLELQWAWNDLKIKVLEEIKGLLK